jgi:endonuclease YncB( thermonuclease family)
LKLSLLFTNLFLIIVCILAYSSLTSFPFHIEESNARCQNGYHKSPSGDCEKVTDTKGMPRCEDGYHRSPDGDCERVSSSASVDTVDDTEDNDKSSRENDDDYNDDSNNNDDNKYFDFTNTKNNNGKNSEDKSNDPLNQIFGNNNNAKDNDKKEESEPTLPKPTLSDEIELAGKVNHVVDGDTLDINDIRIRLSLVDTPERGDPGFKEATQFVVKLCLGENAEVDIDDGQRRGSFGREIGVVYCDGKNLNEQLMDNNLGIIDTRFCEKSEFSNEKWAKPYC